MMKERVHGAEPHQWGRRSESRSTLLKIDDPHTGELITPAAGGSWLP